VQCSVLLEAPKEEDYRYFLSSRGKRPGGRKKGSQKKKVGGMDLQFYILVEREKKELFSYRPKEEGKEAPLSSKKEKTRKKRAPLLHSEGPIKKRYLLPLITGGMKRGKARKEEGARHRR